MSKWQPIKTAPKNELVLVYDPIGVAPEFNGYGWPAATPVHVLPALFRYTDVHGWHWMTIVSEYDFGVSSDPSFFASSVAIKPTYWMPLPAPPGDSC